jgi:hypothetical protein
MALSLARTRAQIQSYIDFLHQYNRLPPRSLRRFADRHAQRALARTVREGKRPRLGGYEFSAVRFRSVSGDGVEAVLGIDRRLRPARPLRAFVGHRFTPGVTNNLRHNLQLLCRPYGVSLWYSDTDVPNGSVFETIVQRSAKATSACSTIAKPKCGRTC